MATKIEKVEAFIAAQELAEPFSFSQWSYASRAICLVRVTADDGTYGWGEGYGPALPVAAGVRHVGQWVVGENPLHEATIWQSLYRRTLDYARSGVLMASISAVDIALWDLKGKLLGQPVSVLLGGRRRDRVQAYATGLYFTAGEDQPGRLAEEAKGYVKQGYKAIKMKVGMTPADDVEHVRRVREAIGPDVKLMVDANHAYSYAEALALAERLEEYDPYWFEEPLSPEDYAGYARLRNATSIPLAGGECEYLTYGFRRLFEAGLGGAVDFAQPDLCASGGLTEGRRIAALATAHGVNVAPHCWGTGVAFAAGLHFVSTLDALPGRLRNVEPLLEMDRTENPLRDEMVRPVFEATDGLVDVPTTPGLGVDVNLQVLEKFRKTVEIG